MATVARVYELFQPPADLLDSREADLIGPVTCKKVRCLFSVSVGPYLAQASQANIFTSMQANKLAGWHAGLLALVNCMRNEVKMEANFFPILAWPVANRLHIYNIYISVGSRASRRTVVVLIFLYKLAPPLVADQANAAFSLFKL